MSSKNNGGGSSKRPKIVLGRFEMFSGEDAFLGEGTSSIAWRGKDTDTGNEVAIKEYKRSSRDGRLSKTTVQKFARQIEVLQELMTPFKRPSDPRLWSDRLAKAKPSRLFLELLDFSKDAAGKPGPDPQDNSMFVVTELGQYSLKDYLHHRQEQRRPLSQESVRNITEALVLVMAGLHAKGLVHLDFKPENVMMFNGRLKLIDVDGCVRIGTRVAVTDSSISFSPCYCAPEWARFLIDETDDHLTISPDLDVWSVGMAVCELVTLDSVLKPMYASFLRNTNGGPQQEAGFLFMEWLSSRKRIPLPRAIEKFNREFCDLILNKLLVCNSVDRASLAECLLDSYVTPSKTPDAKTADKESSKQEEEQEKHPEHEVDHSTTRIRKQAAREDEEGGVNDAVLHKGTLWKLKNGKKLNEDTNWITRDLWINIQGNLCYFSHKENKRLILVDAHKMSGALIDNVSGCAKDFAFKLVVAADAGEEDELYFAAQSDEERMSWMRQLRQAGRIDMAQTMKLGPGMAQDLQQFKLTVKNRRMKVDHESRFDADFKGVLWKVKSEGDRTKPEDFFRREMWIAKNGSLVYWSEREERELVYYTAVDVKHAEIVLVDNSLTAKPWVFQVVLPEIQGIQFAPGEFAAETEESRGQWIDELVSHGANLTG